MGQPAPLIGADGTEYPFEKNCPCDGDECWVAGTPSGLKVWIGHNNGA